MSHYILEFDHQILAFEKQGKWYEAAICAYDLWTKQPNDPNILVCAGTEIWYAILALEYDAFDPSSAIVPDFEAEKKLRDLLWQVSLYGEHHFKDDTTFNTYFGYMYRVMPYNFTGFDGDDIAWKSKGLSMNSKAANEPGNLIAQAMVHSYDDSYTYHEACKKIWDNIPIELWGTSAFQEYLFYILNGNCFYHNAFSSEGNRG